MNRVGLGLAVGAGYVLGRTKKAKLALAVGSMVAGKRMNLSPRMVADLVNQQLKNNPQVKELGEQLRGDLRGAGKAASGALVERQIGALADRLHARTADLRGQGPGERDEEEEENGAEERDETAGDEPEDAGESRKKPEAGERDAPARKAGGTAKKAARKAPADKAAPAKKAAKKAPGAGTAAKKTSSARKTAAKAGGRGGQRKGGGER
ncbi:DNA primase [Streptomyces sp. Ru71]|uniref:DNA primase n=1 Tax=Streptomyces sp. Ru71 TaxID=2080746 RepID=UPI000CDDC964|nr:DNA primase [Streptomyces sp. Ru71]POX50874.1 DNA primase [Streptomyces sp. Ru71]